MEQKKINALFIICAFLIGFGSCALIYPSDLVIKIVSIKDGDEVHSIVPIDVIYDKGDELGLWINGTPVEDFDVFPYLWDNMHYPAGDYEISAGVNKNDKWEYDTVIITIPKEFTVPKDYIFSEDFVVHEGQHVIMNYPFNVYGHAIIHGWNPIDEKYYFNINIFGNLTINANITCNDFICENYSKIYWNNGNISIKNSHYNLYTVLPDNFIRFDDNAMLYLSDDKVNYIDSYEDYSMLYCNNMIAVFYEKSTYIFL